MTPIEIAKTLIVNAKGSPVTTALAMVAIGLLGGGKYMADNGVEPWGTAVAGIGAIVVIVLGFIAKDPKKHEDPPQ